MLAPTMTSKGSRAGGKPVQGTGGAFTEHKAVVGSGDRAPSTNDRGRPEHGDKPPRKSPTILNANALRPNAEPTGQTLAEIGKEAQHAAQRNALLAELEKQGWNLTATAKALGLVNASNVVRALKTLGLEEAYEAAKARGDIAPGRPT